MKYRNRIAMLEVRRAAFDKMKIRTGQEKAFVRPGSQRRSK